MRTYQFVLIVEGADLQSDEMFDLVVTRARWGYQWLTSLGRSTFGGGGSLGRWWCRRRGRA